LSLGGGDISSNSSIHTIDFPIFSDSRNVSSEFIHGGGAASSAITTTAVPLAGAISFQNTATREKVRRPRCQVLSILLREKPATLRKLIKRSCRLILRTLSSLPDLEAPGSLLQILRPSLSFRCLFGPAA
jgi:hypothetical protein